MALSKDLAIEYCEKFPHAKAHPLARLLYKENPSVYQSSEAARAAINKVRGKAGKLHKGVYERAGLDSAFQFEAVGSAPFEALPEPIIQVEDPNSHELGAKRILVLSDVHIPYHDAMCLEGALKYGEERDIDGIILNGDFLDCHALSRFDKDPRKRDFPREIDSGKKALRHIRGRFPRAEIVFNDGNHEERWERYMFVKAPELLGMSDLFELGNVLKFDDLGITRLRRSTHIRVGRLNVLHGHEFGPGGGVNPARWVFLKAGKNVMIGHFHRTSAHTERDMEDSITSAWSTGCLCQRRQDYAPYNKWSSGFAYIESDGRNFRVENRIFVDGEIY